MREPATPAAGTDWRDVVLALVIAVASVAYLAALPRNLAPADEAVQLYEAKRLLEGEVMYRDVFEMTTPGYHLVMALLFRLFGTDIDTARLSAAALHALMAVLVYLTCRRFGIARWLSWPPALACIAVNQPAWPIASQHWLTSTIGVALLFVCSGRERHNARWPLRAGLLLGLMTAVQQQRGVPMAAGVFAWLVLDHVVQRRYRDRPAAPLGVQLAWLVAGGVAVLVPLGLYLLATSGFGPVWQALVIFPIYNYGSVTRSPWGGVTIMSALQSTYTFPAFLKYLPLIGAVIVPRLLYRLVRGEAPEEVARLTLLAVFCGASALSISYFPDFIHIAFIAPAFYVALAESAQWAVSRVRLPRAVAWPLAATASVVLLVVIGQHLHRNLQRQRAAFPIRHPTAFGVVAFPNAHEVQLYEQVMALLAGTPTRALYSYPILSDIYLTADADNPTPYGFFSGLGYNGPEQIADALRILAGRGPRYVVIIAGVLHLDDPIVHYLREAYAPRWAPPDAPRVIYERRAETSPAAAG